MAVDLEPILEQVAAGDQVGAAYRLAQLLSGDGAGRALYEAGTRALEHREEIGEDALRFARLVFAEAVEREPGLAEAHHDLATAMRELGMAEDALPHFRRSLELAPDDLDSLIGLGAALADLGRLDDAIVQLARATEVHPENGRAQANLAIALEAAGRNEESVAAYGRAVVRFDAAIGEAEDEDAIAEAGAQRRWARIQQAELLERMQRWPQAAVVYRRLLEEEEAFAEAEAEAEDEDEDEPETDGPPRLPAELPEGESTAHDGEADGEDGDEDEDGEPTAEELEEVEAGRSGLERVFSRLVQLGRLDLAYLVLDDLGGELADDRTSATYTIYDAGDGVPTIMVESWEDGRRTRLEPG